MVSCSSITQRMVSDRWSVRIKAECGEYDNNAIMCRLPGCELAHFIRAGLCHGPVSYWWALNPIVFSRMNICHFKSSERMNPKCQFSVYLWYFCSQWCILKILVWRFALIPQQWCHRQSLFRCFLQGTDTFSASSVPNTNTKCYIILKASVEDLIKMSFILFYQYIPVMWSWSKLWES